METLVKAKDILLNDPKVRTFYWQALNVLIGLIIVVLTDLDPRYAVVIIPVLMRISKEINKKYLPEVTF